MSNQTHATLSRRFKKTLPALVALFVSSTSCCSAFHPPAMHRHPAYLEYRYQNYDKDTPIIDTVGDVDSCYLKYCLDTGLPVLIDCCELDYCGETGMVIDASIATAVSYDDDAGLVQTTLRRIVHAGEELSTPVSCDKETGMVQTAVLKSGICPNNIVQIWFQL